MKIYYKAQGSGNLLAKDPDTGKRYIIKAGVNNVPDVVAEDLLKKYPKVISTDEEARELRVKSSAASGDLASANEEIKTLKAQVAKLQLIAAEVPTEEETESAKATAAHIAALEGSNAALTKQVKEYEELINAK